MCRKLIKEATETDDDRKKVDHLFVAVHGLRAIGPTPSLDTARQEAAIRLLYHLITTATAAYTHLRAHETLLDLVCRLLLEKKKSALSILLPLPLQSLPFSML